MVSSIALCNFGTDAYGGGPAEDGDVIFDAVLPANMFELAPDSCPTGVAPLLDDSTTFNVEGLVRHFGNFFLFLLVALLLDGIQQYSACSLKSSVV